MGEKQDLQSYTGYSLSETLILATINPKNDNRLFIKLQFSTRKLQVQYVSTCCVQHIARTYLQPHYGNGVFGNVYLSAGQD